MTNDEQEKEALKAYKVRVSAIVDRLKAELKDWVHQHDGDDLFSDPPGDKASAGYATEVTAALMETAIDREIHLLGETDARDLVMSAFDRRAKVLRRRFQ